MKSGKRIDRLESAIRAAGRKLHVIYRGVSDDLLEAIHKSGIAYGPDDMIVVIKRYD